MLQVVSWSLKHAQTWQLFKLCGTKSKPNLESWLTQLHPMVSGFAATFTRLCGSLLTVNTFVLTHNYLFDGVLHWLHVCVLCSSCL